MTNAPPALLEFLYRYDPAIQSLALGLRKVIHEEMSPCHEYIFQMRSKVVLLYGPTEKVIRDNACAIGVYRSHVLLSFRRGADLKDARRLLEGHGKAFRHLTLKTIAELDRPEIRAFLRQARVLAGIRRPRRPAAGGAIVTRVKKTTSVTRQVSPRTTWKIPIG